MEREYPPKFVDGTVVAVVWERVFTIGVACVGDSVNEKKVLRFEEWEYKEGGELKEKKKKRVMDVESDFIFAIPKWSRTDKENGIGKLDNITEVTNEYKHYQMQYF